MNALKEFNHELEKYNLTYDMIRCAHVSFYGDCFDEEYPYACDYVEFKYIDNNIDSELNHFLNFLDREYDEGFGGRRLSGKIWFWNNSWLERNGYDGSEWWEYKKFEISRLFVN